MVDDAYNNGGYVREGRDRCDREDALDLRQVQRVTLSFKTKDDALPHATGHVLSSHDLASASRPKWKPWLSFFPQNLTEERRPEL